ncbi:K(+)-transporting ATPase subunit F [Staphylococcus pseudintermedius]|nr:K(+)-transporting ATPase subunit F [Staphylococcus pseudintermedius]EIE3868689.1 K(+)-transporting ATPase subunit F [Staphylococcus pseudintermedius]
MISILGLIVIVLIGYLVYALTYSEKF